jgi:RNA polymerase sigma factor (sigma-70 family)
VSTKFSRPDAEEKAAPGELVLDLTTADPDALKRQFRTLIPIALQQLQEGFGLRRLRATDELEAEAVLWSACSSFLRHCRDGEFGDAKGLEELAAHLLRIACNRAQRQRRRDKQMRDAAQCGTTHDPADGAPGPDQEAQANELAAYLREVIDSIKRELQGQRDALAIVQAYLEDMKRTQADIASELGISQSTVSRRLDWFNDRIRQMLEEGGMM